MNLWHISAAGGEYEYLLLSDLIDSVLVKIEAAKFLYCKGSNPQAEELPVEIADMVLNDPERGVKVTLLKPDVHGRMYSFGLGYTPSHFTGVKIGEQTIGG